jgi:hypothetical protein
MYGTRMVALGALALLPAAELAAATLTVGAATIQQLVAEKVFDKRGRWYLQDGNCYAYLESPRTRLAGGRVIIAAHLTSQLGMEMSDSCLGSAFVSNVVMSGRLVGSGTTLTLTEVRIDGVDDEAARSALELLQSIAPTTLPPIDILQTIRSRPADPGELPISVETIQIDSVTTTNEAITVRFDIGLRAP